MYCKYCGNIIDDDSLFCRFCGENLQSNKVKNDTNNNNKTKKVLDRPLPKLYCALVVDGNAYKKDILIFTVDFFYKEKCSKYYAHREIDHQTYAKIYNARRSMFGKQRASDYYFKSSVKLAPNIEVSLKRKDYGNLKDQEDGKVCFFNGDGQLITEKIFNLDPFSLLSYRRAKSNETPIKLMLSSLLSDELQGVKYEILPFKNLIDKLYGDAYLIFDTETTGLPVDENAPIEDDKNWPHLVQLSWIKINIKDGSITSKHDYIISPDGFTIPEEATNIHGITNEIAQRRGKPLNYVLKLFADDLETTNVLVGHNVLFDINMVEAEYNRIGWDNYVTLIESIRTICTMNSSRNFCKLPYYDYWKEGYRPPKLQELYFKLFGNNFSNAHNSAADVKATKACFLELVNRGIIKLPTKSH